MILRIFNKYIPAHKFVFFFLESLFMIGMVIVGAYLRFIGNPFSFLTYEGLIPKALLIVITIQLSLYYFDLYDLRTFRSNLELVVRLFQSLGISSIVLAIFYDKFPMLIIGRGIFLISLSFMAGVIISWRIIYNHILKTRQLDQKIIIVGSRQLAKNIAKEIIERADTGFKIIGFIAENPERIGETLVNPSIIGDQSQLYDIAAKEKAIRIIVALGERRGKFPEAQLLECKMRGIAIEEGIAFYEHLTGKYFQTSPSGKPMYSLGYAKNCLKKYTDMYPGYSKLWIEPAYRIEPTA